MERDEVHPRLESGQLPWCVFPNPPKGDNPWSEHDGGEGGVLRQTQCDREVCRLDGGGFDDGSGYGTEGMSEDGAN